MITFKFSPTALPNKTTLVLSGTYLKVGSEWFDLSLIPDGATVEHDVIREATRNGDDYEIKVRLHHGPNAPQETLFPEPITVNTSHWELEYVHNVD